MRRLYLGLYILFLVLFGLLCYLAHEFSNFPGDSNISLWVQGITLPLFAPLMEGVSYLGRVVPVSVTITLLFAVFLLIRRRLEAIFLVVLTAIAGLVNELIKALVDRPRPDGTLDLGANSFPSGHTTYAMAICGCIFFMAPRLLKWPAAALAVRILMVLFIALMGISRVFLNAHWPSDVLGSLLLGGLVLAPGVVFYQHYLKSGREESGVENARAP